MPVLFKIGIAKMLQTMKRIAVDMDGVLANVYEQYISWDEKDTGIRKSLNDVMGKPELESFPHVRRYLLTPGFFRSVPIVENSQKILALLNKKYEVFIVSAATEFPQSLTEKQTWLNEFFPFITWQQMVFCGSKTIINADIVIDDHFKNLNQFNGTTYLFSQPHNFFVQNGRHHRVNSWLEIADLLLR
jgi:5'-nucleotidase